MVTGLDIGVTKHIKTAFGNLALNIYLSGITNKTENHTFSQQLHIGIPFVSSRSKEFLTTDFTLEIRKRVIAPFSKMHLLAHLPMKLASEILNKSEIDNLETYRKNCSSGELGLGRTLTYFDHRFPDGFSTYDWIKEGNALFEYNDMMGLNTHESCSDPLVPTVIAPYKLESNRGDADADLKKALQKGLVGERTVYPIPERYKTAIEILKQAGMEVEIATKPKLSKEEFKSAIKHYMAYKDKFFFRWLASSDASYQAVRRLKEATDEDRFTMAEEYVNKNPEKQWAKSLVECAPKLSRQNTI